MCRRWNWWNELNPTILPRSHTRPLSLLLSLEIRKENDFFMVHFSIHYYYYHFHYYFLLLLCFISSFFSLLIARATTHNVWIPEKFEPVLHLIHFHYVYSCVCVCVERESQSKRHIYTHSKWIIWQERVTNIAYVLFLGEGESEK